LKINFPDKKFLFFVLLAVLTSCQVSRFFIYNFADIRDYKKFPSRKIEKTSAEKFHFRVGYNAKIDSSKISYESEKNVPIEEFLRKHKTVAFIIIRNHTIIFEKIFRGRVLCL
jgi:hypothetical protein